MKKILCLILLSLVTSGLFSARAFEMEDYRNYPNDIALSYGIGSFQTFVSLFADAFIIAIPQSFAKMHFDGSQPIGTIGVSYNRYLGKVVTVGGVVNYNRVGARFHQQEKPENTGLFSMDWLMMMATAKFYWFRKPFVAMYSKVGLGVGVVGSASSRVQDGVRENSPYSVSVLPAAQLTAVSVEFGGRFRGFFELGFGMEGILNAGIKYAF